MAYAAARMSQASGVMTISLVVRMSWMSRMSQIVRIGRIISLVRPAYLATDSVVSSSCKTPCIVYTCQGRDRLGTRYGGVAHEDEHAGRDAENGARG